MTTKIVITPYDNDISILYKWGSYYKIPIRFLLLRDNKYYSVLDIIQEKVDEGNTLPEIYEALMTENKTLTERDFDMLIVAVLSERDYTFTAIMKMLNDFYLAKGGEKEQSPYTNVDIFTLIYEEWRNKVEAQLLKENQHLQYLKAIHNELNKVEALPVSPFQLEQVRIVIKPQLKTGSPVELKHGLDIFAHAIITDFIPFLTFTDNEKREYFKVWQEFPYDYQLLLFPPEKQIKPNLFRFRLWTRKTPAKIAFIEGSYNLEDNELIFICHQSEEGLLREQLALSFPDLDLRSYDITRFSGSFNIYGADLKEAILLDLILTDPRFNSYFYVEESVKPFAEKKRFTIHYKSMMEGFDIPSGEGRIKPLSSVVLTLTPSQLSEKTLIQTDRGEMTFSAGTPYLHCWIKRALDTKTITHFIAVFQRLMAIYMNSKEVEALYATYLPALGKLMRKIKEEVPYKKDETTKIRSLKTLAPDVFVEGYARKCQRNKQPIIISPEEKDQYEKQVFLYKGEPRFRQVLPFPKENSRWLFACPQDETPFPGVIENSLSNAETYPYLPCCYGTDQYERKNSDLNRYLSGRSPGETEELRTQILKTDKFLTPGRMGLLPPNINELLKSIRKEGDFYRYGVMRSPNSLLHCYYQAIGSEEYLNAKDKEEFVRTERMNLTQKYELAITKQELYDQTLDEIKKSILNLDQFFDPNLFYRLLEISGINIYVFSPNAKGEGQFEIPRAKMFHIRTPRNHLKSILIYKHWGSESDNASYPQCELIVLERGKELIKNFEPDVTELVHKAFLFTTQIISYNGKEEPQLNRYMNINYYNLTNGQAKAQIIDDYGKMRALLLTNGITLCFPPSQPENLPLILTPIEAAIESVEASFSNTIETVTKNKQEEVTGVWIGDFFIPVKPTHKYSTLSQGPDNPLTTSGINVSDRIRKLKQDLSFISQIIKWLYILHMKTKNPVNFIDYFITHNGQIVDSSQFYDFRRLPRLFPKVSSMIEALQYLEQHVPSLVKSHRLIFYNEKFADKMKIKINRMIKELEGRELELPQVIEDYYQLATDFPHQASTSVYIGQRNLQIGLKETKRNLIILTQLTFELKDKTEPFLYQGEQGKIYQIQNVRLGNIYGALAVAYSWYEKQINPGFLATPLEPGSPVPVHIIYGISSSGQLTMVEDRSQGQEHYLMLLQYSDDRYGAILPL